MNASDKVKQIADRYIEAIYGGVCPPMQMIEIRLAFYGGMMAMIGESARIANAEGSEEEAMQKMAETHQAIQSRALKLNQERTFAGFTKNEGRQP